MENKSLIARCEQVAQTWLDSPLYDEETKAAVREMMSNEDKTELIDSFYRSTLSVLQPKA